MLVLRFLKLVWDYSPKRAALTAFLTLLGSITEGFGLILLVPLLGLLQAGSEPVSGIAGTITTILERAGVSASVSALMALFLFLVLVRAVVHYVKSVVSAQLQMEFLDDLRSRSFRAFTGAKWKWLSGLRRSDHSNILLNEVNRIGSAVIQSFSLATSGVMAIAYLTVAFALSVPMTLLSLVVGGLAMYLLRRQHRAARILGREATDVSKRVQQVIEEGLAGVKLTKTLGNEDRHNQLLDSYIANQRNNNISFAKLSAKAASMFQVLVALLMAALVWVGIQGLALPLPNLLTMVLIFTRMAPMVRSIQMMLNNILHSQGALENLEVMMEQARLNADASPTSTTPAPKLTRNLTLENISFGYDGVTSLKNINLDIAAHKTTAIMGPSGAGKSTLADIIMGLMTPDSGRVLVDGVELDQGNLVAWRHSIAYVSQDIFLFHDSVRKNLLWAKADATDAQLAKALSLAAAEFVYTLPQGLDTIVGDGGMRLSGGERQRIALARAMLQDPEILILDEATSALDIENEARIVDAIENLHGTLTVIVIGHRLPTLEHADKVVVLREGQVAKYGSWAEIQ